MPWLDLPEGIADLFDDTSRREDAIMNWSLAARARDSARRKAYRAHHPHKDRAAKKARRLAMAKALPMREWTLREPCACGGIIERRPGSKVPIHLGRHCGTSMKLIRRAA